MRMLRLLMLLAVASILMFTACDETNPEDDSKQAEVENTLKALDAQMGGMGEIGESPMMMAAAQMPPGLMDMDLMLPKMVKGITPNSLGKNAYDRRAFETLTDTTVQNILDMLDSLYGTHTYTGTEWVHDDSPSNQVIIIFPFINMETNTPHIAEVKFHSIVVSQTNLGGEFQMSVDDVPQLWVTLSLEGSDLLSDNAVPSLVSVDGGMRADNNITVNFSLLVTNNGAEFEVGVAGLPGMTLTVVADNFFETMASDEDPDITSIGFGYGSVELVLNNMEPTSLGEDIGDVFYNDSKVGDIVVEQEGIFIVFNNGNRTDITELLPNLLAMMEGIPV